MDDGALGAKGIYQATALAVVISGARHPAHHTTLVVYGYALRGGRRESL